LRCSFLSDRTISIHERRGLSTFLKVYIHGWIRANILQKNSKWTLLSIEAIFHAIPKVTDIGDMEEEDHEHQRKSQPNNFLLGSEKVSVEWK
jgi:hypothetical protein